MKFLYVDESGNEGNVPYLTFFGFYVDGYRLKKVMSQARPLLDAIANAYPENLRELKSSRLVNGAGAWRRVDANERKRLFRTLTGFVSESGCHGYAYILNRQEYRSRQAQNQVPDWASNEWQTGALALSMFLQRDNNDAKKNKGLSVLIFDDNQAELPRLSDFLLSSTPDVDAYYERKRRAEPFDQIIDTAFSIKSDHSHLVQISDACAFALRRRAELELGGKQEAWQGELAFYQGAVADFAARVKFPSKTWVAKPHCDAATALKTLGVTDLNKWVCQ